MSTGKCLVAFGDVQVFHICFHSDSGLSYSAHQHVWQYRDIALAWRGFQPSVRLNNGKDETGFSRIWKRGMLSEDCGGGGRLAVWFLQKYPKPLGGGQKSRVRTRTQVVGF